MLEPVLYPARRYTFRSLIFQYRKGSIKLLRNQRSADRPWITEHRRFVWQHIRTCPYSGRINASNPCSEYTFLDDSACNLASLNLVRFLDADRVQRSAVQTCGQAAHHCPGHPGRYGGHPTESIATNSHDYRPLGLGYANLGALLMSLGLARREGR